MEKLHSAVHYEHFNIIMLMFKIHNYRTDLLTLLCNETNKIRKYKFIYNFFYINSTVRIFKYFKIMIIFESQHKKL